MLLTFKYLSGLYILTDFSNIIQLLEGTTSFYVVHRILCFSNDSCSHVTELILAIQHH